jgi:2-oxo-4-hydroxy-4-carboxy--5-ureidoimidazoline (OHCU) decarboxylase/N-acetylglutamate synthase-like GNAT family acetyltransferase
MDALVLRGVEVQDFGPADHAWAERLLGDAGGGVRTVARLGELIDPFTLQGLVAERSGTAIGLATVQESRQTGMEIVTLHANPRGAGAGSALVEAARQVAAASGHHRLWLVTTSDNLPAIGFYLHRGFHVARVHEGAVAADRALKPQIPMTNPENGLPLRDLVEFELDPTAEPAGRVAFPEVRDLDALPIEAAMDQLEPLFEGAPRFLVGLGAARPFVDDGGLVAAALQVGRELSEDEAIELVNAHPRIGGDPAAMSAASRAEQGYERVDANDGDEDEANREPEWVAEELAGLNEVYEARFGFRFTVFVAGRPRAAIIPLIEAALRNDREAELRRAVEDCIRIAADRLLSLRGGPPPEPEEWA